jgi:hypothetical protein
LFDQLHYHKERFAERDEERWREMKRDE